jgi:uncharacterized protein
MTGNAPVRVRRVLSRRAGLGLTAVLLAVVTVVANRVLPGWSLGGWAYPFVNGAAAVVLVLLAARCGLSAGAVGLRRDALRRSALVGLAGAGLMALALLVAFAVPPVRDAFDDERAADLSPTWLLWVAAVRIPIGTVLLEEIAFRGVLPALLGGGDRWKWRPVLGASALFGLWHALPSMSLVGQNAALGSLFGPAAVLVPLLAVAGSTIAGVWLCFWRYAGHGLLAPILVHLAANNGGLLLAWMLAR